MKLTPSGVKQLARYIEKQMNDCGYTDGPLDDTYAYWIAQWVREQMETEAFQFFAKVTTND